MKRLSHPKPQVQPSAARTTLAPAVKRSVQTSPAITDRATNLPNEPTDWTWVEAALSRHFGHPVQLSDPGEVKRSATQPGQSLGGLADSDQDELWYPPLATPIFYADANSRPCDPANVKTWTFSGSPAWFKCDAYPPPAAEQ